MDRVCYHLIPLNLISYQDTMKLLHSLNSIVMSYESENLLYRAKRAPYMRWSDVEGLVDKASFDRRKAVGVARGQTFAFRDISAATCSMVKIPGRRGNICTYILFIQVQSCDVINTVCVLCDKFNFSIPSVTQIKIVYYPLIFFPVH